MIDKQTLLKWPQWKAAISGRAILALWLIWKNIPPLRVYFKANFGATMVGVMLSWTTFIEDRLETEGYNGFVVTDEEFDWISGTLALGAILGASVAGPLSDLYGRKKAIVASMVPCLFGEGFMVGAINPTMLMLARFLNGVGIGATSCVAPMYVDEISHVSLRGTLGSLFEVMLMTGLFLSYVAGMTLSTFNFFLFCGIFPVLLIILLSSQPDSPYYLILKNNRKEARKSLRLLRGDKFSIDAELQEITETLEQMKREKLSLFQVFKTRTARLGVFLCIFIVFIQQLSGIDAITFFTNQIFKDAGSELEPKYCTLISGAACLGGTILAALFIDRWGRKTLLLMSSSITALCLCILGGYFYAHHYSLDLITHYPSVSIIPLVTICVYFVAFSFGLGPVPWMIVPELVPAGARSLMTSVAFAFSWLFTFIVATYFIPATEMIGDRNAFLGFGSISIVGFFVLLFCLPETKGKTRDEIQELLGG